jgi:hypothetical protein
MWILWSAGFFSSPRFYAYDQNGRPSQSIAPQTGKYDPVVYQYDEQSDSIAILSQHGPYGNFQFGKLSLKSQIYTVVNNNITQVRNTQSVYSSGLEAIVSGGKFVAIMEIQGSDRKRFHLSQALLIIDLLSGASKYVDINTFTFGLAPFNNAIYTITQEASGMAYSWAQLMLDGTTETFDSIKAPLAAKLGPETISISSDGTAFCLVVNSTNDVAVLTLDVSSGGKNQHLYPFNFDSSPVQLIVNK